MRVLEIIFFCLFGTALGTQIETKVTVTCNLPLRAYSGTVQLMEWDREMFSDELTEEIEFNKMENEPNKPHSIFLRGEESEMFFSVEPYLMVRHYCTPTARRQEYRVNLTPCSVSSTKCSESVNIQLGKTNSYKLSQFHQE